MAGPGPRHLAAERRVHHPLQPRVRLVLLQAQRERFARLIRRRGGVVVVEPAREVVEPAGVPEPERVVGLAVVVVVVLGELHAVAGGEVEEGHAGDARAGIRRARLAGRRRRRRRRDAAHEALQQVLHDAHGGRDARLQ